MKKIEIINIIYILLISLLFYGCIKNDSVTIINNSLVEKINDFHLRAKEKMFFANDTVSIFIETVKSNVIINLYSSKHLKYEYYIGQTKINQLTILVYSDSKSLNNELYKINYLDAGSKDIKEQNMINVYMEIWCFDGKRFILPCSAESSEE